MRRFSRRERDSNPRVVSHKLISSQPRYDRFDTSPYGTAPDDRRRFQLKYYNIFDPVGIENLTALGRILKVTSFSNGSISPSIDTLN